MVLGCMKAAAEAFLGAPLRHAVVTVPAYFNDSQRQATKDAAAIAGLSVLRIINEPTAAALAYGFDRPAEDERYVLIFDFGGGTFDVSVLCIEEGIFEVRSTAGDTHLGGEDLDARLTEHLAQEFRRRHELDLSANRRALRRLRTASERAKRTLSAANEASIELDSLHEGKDFSTTVTRARFEELCGDLLRRTMEPVRQALTDAALGVADIHEVVLVGGSTRIPMVQALLQELFKGRRLAQTVNPDEAVAAGAAIQAALLDGEASEIVTDMVLLDVTPLSLGTDLSSGIMSVIIPRNTTIPVKKTKLYTTSQDNQTTVNVDIREGERPMCKDNNLLGKFTLKGLPRLPAGRVSVKVTFELDADGIMHASAVEESSGTANDLTIINDKGRLSREQIARLLEEAEEFKLEDERKMEIAAAKNDLERYCSNMKYRVADNPKVSSSTQQTLTAKCDETLRWLDDTPDATAEEYQRKKRDLELLCDLVFMKL